MTRKHKTAVVFGGTGFIGRQVVRELAACGISVKVATRIPERAYFLRPCGGVGQVVPVPCDYTPEGVRAVIQGCDYVVNCIGILFEKSRNGFQKAHIDIPRMIAEACAQENVESFVHISALACERGSSKYAHSKLLGEEGVHYFFPSATILRPSVVFGEDDSFFNMFAEMARYLPFLPLIYGGRTKFQPVYVGDVAAAVLQSLFHKEAQARIFELGGSQIVTFRQVYEILAAETGRKRMLFPLPGALAKMQAFFLEMLPQPPLTRDQVESLKTDNVMNKGALGLNDLGIEPTMMGLVLPSYLERYRSGGRFASITTA